MPSILDLFLNLLKDPSSEINKLMIKQIVKILFRVLHIDMSPYFRDAAVNKAWMDAVF